MVHHRKIPNLKSPREWNKNKDSVKRKKRQRERKQTWEEAAMVTGPRAAVVSGDGYAKWTAVMERNWGKDGRRSENVKKGKKNENVKEERHLAYAEWKPTNEAKVKTQKKEDEGKNKRKTRERKKKGNLKLGIRAVKNRRYHFIITGFNLTAVKDRSYQFFNYWI